MTAALTEQGCHTRRERLWAALDPAIQTVAVGEPRNVTWLCGFRASPFVFRSQNARAVLILERQGGATLIADNVQRPFVESAFADDSVLAPWYRGIESAPPRFEPVLEATQTQLLKCTGSVAFDQAMSPDSLDPFRGAVDVTGVLIELQRRKEPDEVAVMRQSIAAGEAAYRAALSGVHAGMTDLEAFLLVQRAAIEAAGEQVEVYGDFAAGPQTAKGGGPPVGYTIQPGDLFLLDFSVVIQGYRGDFAGTWSVDGEPPDEIRKMADICLEALALGESLLRPGLACRELDAAMRAIYLKNGMGDQRGHHLGHGLGLGHPDPPYVVPESGDTLQEGDIVTLEPGLYRPDLERPGGVRFEHNYLITSSGAERLTNHPLGVDTAAS